MSEKEIINGIAMRKLPRMQTTNPIMVKENGGAYPTWYYDTDIIRKKCCGKDPDLYAGTKVKTFFKEGAYLFKCNSCGIVGGSYITPNGAAADWNKVLSTIT